MKYIYCLIAIIPIIIYIVNFNSHTISDDPEKWAFFGDYIGGVYSVVLTCLITYLMYKLNKVDETNKEKKELIKSLYLKINEFNLFPLNNQDEINKYLLLVYNSELVLDDNNLFNKLISMYDYYLGLCNNTCTKDFNKEEEIINILKKKYNG